MASHRVSCQKQTAPIRIQELKPGEYGITVAPVRHAGHIVIAQNINGERIYVDLNGSFHWGEKCTIFIDRLSKGSKIQVVVN